MKLLFWTFLVSMLNQLVAERRVALIFNTKNGRVSSHFLDKFVDEK